MQIQLITIIRFPLIYLGFALQRKEVYRAQMKKRRCSNFLPNLFYIKTKAFPIRYGDAALAPTSSP